MSNYKRHTKATLSVPLTPFGEYVYKRIFQFGRPQPLVGTCSECKGKYFSTENGLMDAFCKKCGTELEIQIDVDRLNG